MAAWTLYSGQNSTVCSGNLGGPPLSAACIGANPKSGASYWCMKAGTGNASITVSFTEPLWAAQIGIFVADCTGSFITSRTSLRLADGSTVPLSCPPDLCNGALCKNVAYWYTCDIPRPLSYTTGMTFWVYSGSSEKLIDAPAATLTSTSLSTFAAKPEATESKPSFASSESHTAESVPAITYASLTCTAIAPAESGTA
ncbi:hypothetical protein HYH02_014353 [Chlamydomonas schloesseri]|uniref:Uncharacterized protein n=1 Tax=Chlamydomonas schloesseri TaxID=2026947 RepID=A0A835VWW8_9CHLO|nr:hypothetical protein HYH02_014353 [Chlamydomonas schloesseri]|eukprot:KAG2428549.1 hypothetical protein HYH02_014353 [Chlamydomonas schloesseri]